MGSTHELYLTMDDGTKLALLKDWLNLDYTRVINNVGVINLLLPGTFDRSILHADQRIEVWRAPEGGAMKVRRIYFIRRITDSTDEGNLRSILVEGFDTNMLLILRIIAAAAGSADAAKTAAIDDMMKAIVRESSGTLAAAARQFNTSYFSVQADLTAGPSITKSFSWRNVHNVLLDLAEAARQAGTEVYFDIVPTTPTTFEFRTNTGQPGMDHTYPNGVSPVIFSLENGNLRNPKLIEDWSEELTYIYAAGQGEGAFRTTYAAEDTARSGRSIWGRREGFKDARNESTLAGVTNSANEMLASGEPRVLFGASLLDTPQARYGVDWDWGDRVTTEYQGQRDGLVRADRVIVNSQGKEMIEARIEVDV